MKQIAFSGKMVVWLLDNGHRQDLANIVGVDVVYNFWDHLAVLYFQRARVSSRGPSFLVHISIVLK